MYSVITAQISMTSATVVLWNSYAVYSYLSVIFSYIEAWSVFTMWCDVITGSSSLCLDRTSWWQYCTEVTTASETDNGVDYFLDDNYKRQTAAVLGGSTPASSAHMVGFKTSHEPAGRGVRIQKTSVRYSQQVWINCMELRPDRPETITKTFSGSHWKHCLLQY